jgi:THO complex subunit 1
MAVPELSSQNAVIARMHELLRRARAIKRSTSIDPPLQASALIEGDEALVESVGKEGDALVEGAAKSIFYATVVSCQVSTQKRALTYARAPPTLRMSPS